MGRRGSDTVPHAASGVAAEVHAEKGEGQRQPQRAVRSGACPNCDLYY